jgi:hypothetical protein
MTTDTTPATLPAEALAFITTDGDAENTTRILNVCGQLSVEIERGEWELSIPLAMKDAATLSTPSSLHPRHLLDLLALLTDPRTLALITPELDAETLAGAGTFEARAAFALGYELGQAKGAHDALDTVLAEGRALLARKAEQPAVTVEEERTTDRDGSYTLVRVSAGDALVTFDPAQPSAISLGPNDTTIAELRNLRAVLASPQIAALLDA